MNNNPTPKHLYQIKPVGKPPLDFRWAGSVLVKWPSGKSAYCFTSKANAKECLDWYKTKIGSHRIVEARKGGVLI